MKQKLTFYAETSQVSLSPLPPWIILYDTLHIHTQLIEDYENLFTCQDNTLYKKYIHYIIIIYIKIFDLEIPKTSYITEVSIFLLRTSFGSSFLFYVECKVPHLEDGASIT